MKKGESDFPPFIVFLVVIFGFLGLIWVFTPWIRALHYAIPGWYDSYAHWVFNLFNFHP